MQIDYRQMTKMINIRMNQIEDASLQMERFNTEYQALNEVKHLIAKILIVERGDEEMFKKLADTTV
jgi:hypothetical protein